MGQERRRPGAAIPSGLQEFPFQLWMSPSRRGLPIHRLLRRLIFGPQTYLNAENSPFLPLDPNPLSGQVNQVDPLERTRRLTLKIRCLVRPLFLFVCLDLWEPNVIWERKINAFLIPSLRFPCRSRGATFKGPSGYIPGLPHKGQDRSSFVREGLASQGARGRKKAALDRRLQTPP